MRTKITLFAVFLLILLATNWALINPHLFPLHDYVHGARIAEMARGLAEGQVPVRWSSNFGYGYGMPLFEFYAPLPYYVGASLYMVGVPLSLSIKLLFVLCSLGTAVGAYKLGSSLWGRTAGLLVASAYTLAPYRAVNLYIRGALGEAFGMMALPWVLYACLLVWQRKPRAWLLLTTSLVVLFLSHNLVTMMAIPTIVIWAVGQGLLQRQKRVGRAFWLGLGQIAASALLAAVLAAFYLAPAFLEKHYTKVDSLITTGYFDYHLHFLYIRQFFNPIWKYGGSGWGADDGFSFFFGWGQWAGLLMTFSLLIARGRGWLTKQRRFLGQLLLIGGLLASSLLLTTFKTEFIWQTIPVFTYIQFPWRFLSIATLCIALLVGAGLTQLSAWQRRTLGAVLIGVLLLNAWYFRPEKYLENDDALYYADARRIRTEMSGILPDFIPAQVWDKVATQPNDDQILFCAGQDACQFENQTVVSHGHEKLITVSLPNEQVVSLAIAGFPGWVTEVDGVGTDWSTDQRGLISLRVPAGTHTIGAWFGQTQVRAAADLTTGLALLIFCTLLWWEYDRDKRKN